jgi:hypothetical protein
MSKFVVIAIMVTLILACGDRRIISRDTPDSVIASLRQSREIERLPLLRLQLPSGPNVPLGLGIDGWDSARVVARDSAEWDSLWLGAMGSAPRPAVAFDTSMAILVATPAMVTGGWGILIDSVLATSSSILVFVTTVQPCGGVDFASRGGDAAVAPRREGAVLFINSLVDTC